MNLANSSIWDHATGFGGDGDKDGPETVGEGRCVTDGPFTELRPVIYNHTRKVHCLSRGFRDGDIKGRLSGEKFSPENVGSILRLGNYTDFLQRVERDLHNTLHTSINGDFKAMTAANGSSSSSSSPLATVTNSSRPPLLLASRQPGSSVVAVAAGKPQRQAV